MRKENKMFIGQNTKLLKSVEVIYRRGILMNKNNYFENSHSLMNSILIQTQTEETQIDLCRLFAKEDITVNLVIRKLGNFEREELESLSFLLENKNLISSLKSIVEHSSQT